jgi:hypothetical protein
MLRLPTPCTYATYLPSAARSKESGNGAMRCRSAACNQGTEGASGLYSLQGRDRWHRMNDSQCGTGRAFFKRKTSDRGCWLPARLSPAGKGRSLVLIRDVCAGCTPVGTTVIVRRLQVHSTSHYERASCPRFVPLRRQRVHSRQEQWGAPGNKLRHRNCAPPITSSA